MWIDEYFVFRLWSIFVEGAVDAASVTDYDGLEEILFPLFVPVLIFCFLDFIGNPVTAIDIDDWCVNNSRDNIELNGINNITVELGDAGLLEGREAFDVIIANINRNILLADMDRYAACMHKGSELFMSGFYVEDILAIREKAESLGMKFLHHREKNNWAAVKFVME